MPAMGDTILMGDTIPSQIIMAMNPRPHIITIPITHIRMGTITIHILKDMWAGQDTRAVDTGEADTGAVVGILEATVATATGTGTGNNGFCADIRIISVTFAISEEFCWWQ